MTEDNNRDRSQDEGKGQEGIDRETERRNRENETGEQSGQPATDQSGQPPSSQDRPSSAFGQQGQSAGGSSFVGASGDRSSDYLTKSEDNQDFAPEGQGAQDSNAGASDIETGQPQDDSDDTTPTGK